jgi:hypothetical protein
MKEILEVDMSHVPTQHSAVVCQVIKKGCRHTQSHITFICFQIIQWFRHRITILRNTYYFSHLVPLTVTAPRPCYKLFTLTAHHFLTAHYMLVRTEFKFQNFLKGRKKAVKESDPCLNQDFITSSWCNDLTQFSRRSYIIGRYGSKSPHCLNKNFN